jgi:hypothetical protein
VVFVRANMIVHYFLRPPDFFEHKDVVILQVLVKVGTQTAGIVPAIDLRILNASTRFLGGIVILTVARIMLFSFL